MSDEFQLLRESERGQKALDVIENEIYKEAFDIIRAALHDKFEFSKPADRDIREEAHRYLHVLREIERHIESVMTTGKMANIVLSERESKLRRIHPVHGVS